MLAKRVSFATPSDRLSAFFEPEQPRETYTDAEIDEIAGLLERCSHVASRCPRIYIILRAIGELEFLGPLLNEGFNDKWFPVEPQGLPQFLNPSVKARIGHRHFKPGEVLPFEVLSRLGSGNYGQVDRIESKISFRHYALKRIRRRTAFGINSKEAMKRFLSEIHIVKALKHSHIIEYIGSYTDKTYLGLIMSPVADMDLAAYLDQTSAHVEAASIQNTEPSALQHRKQALATEACATLRTCFGCLAAALAYLHDRSIRHKDVKPQNILVNKGNILLADFGLSNEFADDVGSTTSGLTLNTPRYSPPEVAAFEARNTSADIWSLGCVFFEMSAALQGYSISWVKKYFSTNYSGSTHFYANHDASDSLLSEWEATWDPKSRAPLRWVRRMLQINRLSRPTASSILEAIICPEETEYAPTTFCGICCVPGEETDSEDSLADEFSVLSPEDNQVLESSVSTFTDETVPRSQLRASESPTVELTPTDFVVPDHTPWTSDEKVQDLQQSSIPMVHEIVRMYQTETKPSNLMLNLGAMETTSSHTQHADHIVIQDELQQARLQHQEASDAINTPDWKSATEHWHTIVARSNTSGWDINKTDQASPTSLSELGSYSTSGPSHRARSLSSSDTIRTASDTTSDSSIAQNSSKNALSTDSTFLYENIYLENGDDYPDDTLVANYVNSHQNESRFHRNEDQFVSSPGYIPTENPGTSMEYDFDHYNTSPYRHFRYKATNQNTIHYNAALETQSSNGFNKSEVVVWPSGLKKTEPNTAAGTEVLQLIPTLYENPAYELATAPNLVFGARLQSLDRGALKLGAYGLVPVVVAKCCSFIATQKTISNYKSLISGDSERVKALMYQFSSWPHYGNSLDWKPLPVDIYDITTVLHRYLFSLPGYLISEENTAQMLRDARQGEMSAFVAWYQTTLSKRRSVRSAMDISSAIMMQLMGVFQHYLCAWKMPVDDIVAMYYGAIFTPFYGMKDRSEPLQRLALRFWIMNHYAIWKKAVPTGTLPQPVE